MKGYFVYFEGRIVIQADSHRDALRQANDRLSNADLGSVETTKSEKENKIKVIWKMPTYKFQAVNTGSVPLELAMAMENKKVLKGLEVLRGKLDSLSEEELIRLDNLLVNEGEEKLDKELIKILNNY